MKKRFGIILIILIMLITTLSGCLEMSGVPDQDSKEDDELQDWIQTIEERVYVTVWPWVFVSNTTGDTPKAYKPILIEIKPSSGTPYSSYKYTDETGYVGFDETKYSLDRGDSISVKATFTQNGRYATDWLNYDTAKSRASYTERDGYTYYWSVYLQINI